MLILNPFPIKSSAYSQINCSMSINRVINKEGSSSTKKDFTISVCNFLTITNVLNYEF